MFVSGGYDGNLKVWQFNDTSKPLYTQRGQQVGWVYDVTWCPQGNAIYFCGSDEPKCMWDPLWLDRSHVRNTLYAHSETSHGPVWKARAVRRGNAVFTVSVSGGGTAILGDVSALTASKARKFPYVRMFSIANVRAHDESEGGDDAPVRAVEIEIDSNHHFIETPKEDAKGTTIVPDATTAIYALAIGASPDEADSSSSGLAAYGTALGLVRCQALPI
jgi:WD40 repeat protein